MKAYRRYVGEQIDRGPRLAQDVENALAEFRLVAMIPRLREARGWSQFDLVKVMGIRQPQIVRIE